jgi:hypothetical protein
MKLKKSQEIKGKWKDIINSVIEKNKKEKKEEEESYKKLNISYKSNDVESDEEVKKKAERKKKIAELFNFDDDNEMIDFSNKEDIKKMKKSKKSNREIPEEDRIFEVKEKKKKTAEPKKEKAKVVEESEEEEEDEEEQTKYYMKTPRNFGVGKFKKDMYEKLDKIVLSLDRNQNKYGKLYKKLCDQLQNAIVFMKDVDNLDFVYKKADIEKYDKIYNGINNILEKINKEYNKTKKNQNDKTDKIDDLELTKYKPRTQENLVNNITRLTENLSKGLKN